MSVPVIAGQRRWRRWVPFFLVLVALGAVAVVVPIVYNLRLQLRPEQLEQARQRWREQGPPDYDLSCERKTTEAGFFALSLLPAGEYRVTISATGFQTLTQARVVLDALAVVGLDLKLQIGTENQSITVETAPSMLKTDDVALGGSVENNVYDSLPLAMNASGSES